MAKRRDKAPPAWSGHPPDKGEYWFHGGPWVPPDEIPAGGYVAKPEDIRPYEKPATRHRSVGKLLDDAEAHLAREIAHYRDLHERGVAALPWEWERDKIANGEADPAVPNGLHYQFSNTYRSIAQLRSQIAVYRAIVDGLEPGMMPLFNQPRKP